VILETRDKAEMRWEGDGRGIGGATVTTNLKRIERADALSIRCVDETGRWWELLRDDGD
jgi:hypothetical protein